MLVNLKEFYKAVTGVEYRSNTDMVVNALMRWGIPMVIPDNLPSGARKHRRVDIANVEKARTAYRHEREVEERLKKPSEIRVPPELVLKNPKKARYLKPAPTTLDAPTKQWAQLDRIERKVDKLLEAWGVVP